MSRLGLAPTLVAATLFLVTTLAAQEPAVENGTVVKIQPAPPPSPTPMNAMAGSMRGQELLKRLDKNGDGKIDDDERGDAQEEAMKERIERQVRATTFLGGTEQLRTRLLELFDKNKDGRLDEEERAAAEKFAEDRSQNPNAATRDELVKRFDRNSDGKVEGDERATMMQFLTNLPPPAPRSSSAAVGSSGRPELRETEKFIRGAIEANATERGRFDKNSDGKLDDIEWAMARRQLAVYFGPETSPQQDQQRLAAVADEVARRREIREQSVTMLGAEGKMPSGGATVPTPEEIERLRSKPRESLGDDERRILAVSDEVARRRKLREQSESIPAPAK